MYFDSVKYSTAGKPWPMLEEDALARLRAQSRLFFEESFSTGQRFAFDSTLAVTARELREFNSRIQLRNTTIVIYMFDPTHDVVTFNTNHNAMAFNTYQQSVHPKLVAYLDLIRKIQCQIVEK
jgi:hypothetical protein